MSALQLQDDAVVSRPLPCALTEPSSSNELHVSRQAWLKDQVKTSHIKCWLCTPEPSTRAHEILLLPGPVWQTARGWRSSYTWHWSAEAPTKLNRTEVNPVHLQHCQWKLKTHILFHQKALNNSESKQNPTKISWRQTAIFLRNTLGCQISLWCQTPVK